MQTGLLLLPWPVSAQVKIGDFSTNLNGTFSSGYNTNYGNLAGSNHSWTVGGNANLSGSFYNPNFLSYNASLYLNQSRANSDFQSISNTSGVNVGANIFGGSRFPGSISYSKALDAEGSYDVPGIANYVTHGNSDTLGLGWNENLPGVPSLSAGFQLGSSRYSVYGTNTGGSDAFHALNLHSGYQLAGFNMGAYYSTGGSHARIPQVVAGLEGTETHSNSSGSGFNVGHRLPLQGSIAASWNRSDYDNQYLGTVTSGSIDMINTLAEVRPTSKLSLAVTANYSDNLSGQLIQAVVAAGGVAPGLNSNQSSNSLDLMANVNYVPMPHLQASAFAERRTQLFLEENYGVNSYGGSASYSRALLDGNFNASLNVAENTSDKTGENTLSFVTNEMYSSNLLGWHVSGMFSYSQNAQTLLVTYMNSSYSFSGNANRRWGRLNFSAGGGGSRTALTAQPGTASGSQSYNISFGYSPLLTATGSYSKASGQALATGSGLAPVPVPSPIVPSSLVSLYGGNSYSFALSSAPVRGLLLSASYAKSNSDTSSSGVVSTNGNDEINSFVQYQIRKLNFTSGYSRLGQGFSGSGTPPEVISSFYIGVSRWFNFF